MNTGLGIRDYENAAIKDHLRNAPLLVLFFGIGLGGRGGAYSSLADALSTQFSYGMWHRSKYMYGRGALFHNLYANIALCLGIVGIGIVVLMNIGIWKRISVSCKNNRLERYALHLFHLSFLLMNYYRWSAVCGISEMIILALIVKNIEQENYSINNGHTVEKQLQQLL